MERRIRAKHPMIASSFGGSSVKRYVISVSRMAGRSQRPCVSHRSRGLSPMKVDLDSGVSSSGGSEGLESDLLRKPESMAAGCSGAGLVLTATGEGTSLENSIPCRCG
ncbi:hypothetical protein DY000_02004092 [Brassica cretica]|uniref:Uncharacterized protein n=1 Tax=Brassica cretica TaxID=69181 RepID=A0ABQ7CB12_BRACR|nr:hypothetical protein DY000_02004092 [Brassica cretica]